MEKATALNLAVVEDSKEEFDLLQSYLCAFEKGTEWHFNVTWFRSAELFLEAFSSQFDLVFMDIALGNMTGMEAAQRMRKTDASVGLIFVTNLAQFAVKGYEVNAYDFIVKPVSYSDFSFKLSRYLKNHKSQEDNRVILENRGSRLAVSVNDILYLEVMGHQVTYHTVKGSFEVYGVMKKAAENLPETSFQKCNNCYLVNLRYVDAVDGNDVLIGDKRLAISHPRKKDFINALNRYFGRNS